MIKHINEYRIYFKPQSNIFYYMYYGVQCFV